jgi:hypothetical protein
MAILVWSCIYVIVGCPGLNLQIWYLRCFRESDTLFLLFPVLVQVKLSGSTLPATCCQHLFKLIYSTVLLLFLLFFPYIPFPLMYFSIPTYVFFDFDLCIFSTLPYNTFSITSWWWKGRIIIPSQLLVVRNWPMDKVSNDLIYIYELFYTFYFFIFFPPSTVIYK